MSNENQPNPEALKQAIDNLGAGSKPTAEQDNVAIKKTIDSLNLSSDLKQHLISAGLDLNNPDKLTPEKTATAFDKVIGDIQDNYKRDSQLEINREKNSVLPNATGDLLKRDANRKIEELKNARQKMLDALPRQSVGADGTETEVNELRKDIERKTDRDKALKGDINSAIITCIDRGMRSNLSDFYWLMFGLKKPDQRFLDTLDDYMKLYQENAQALESRRKELRDLGYDPSQPADGGTLANKQTKLDNQDTLFEPIAFTEDGIAGPDTPADKIVSYVVPTKTATGAAPGDDTVDAAQDKVINTAVKQGVIPEFMMQVGNDKLLSVAAKGQGITQDMLQKQQPQPGFEMEVGNNTLPTPSPIRVR